MLLAFFPNMTENLMLVPRHVFSMRTTMKYLTQDSHTPCQDLNPGPSKHKTRVLITTKNVQCQGMGDGEYLILT